MKIFMRRDLAANKSCVNCHFLQRRDRFENGQEFHTHWEPHEIENRMLDEKGRLARVPICSRGVWDGGIDTSLSGDDKRLKSILEENRKDSCFFVRRNRSMSNDAAYLLWERLNENREVRKRNWTTRISLFLAGIGTIVGILGLERNTWIAFWERVQFLFN